MLAVEVRALEADMVTEGTMRLPIFLVHEYLFACEVARIWVSIYFIASRLSLLDVVIGK